MAVTRDEELASLRQRAQAKRRALRQRLVLEGKVKGYEPLFHSADLLYQGVVIRQAGVFAKVVNPYRGRHGQ